MNRAFLEGSRLEEKEDSFYYAPVVELFEKLKACNTDKFKVSEDPQLFQISEPSLKYSTNLDCKYPLYINPTIKREFKVTITFREQ